MAIVCTNDLLCNKIGAEMITPEEYRKKYEAGESAGIYCENIDRHSKLDYDGMTYCQHCYREMKTENQKLREAFNAAKAFIEANKDDPDIADIYDRYAKAEKALNR